MEYLPVLKVLILNYLSPVSSVKDWVLNLGCVIVRIHTANILAVALFAQGPSISANDVAPA